MRFVGSFIIALSVLLVLALTSFASAGVLDITSVSYSSSASHDSDVTVSFNVTYSGTAAATTITFNESTTNLGTWKTLPSQTVISNNSVPVPFSAVLSIPKHASGTLSATLKVDSMNSSADDSEPITITITNSPALDITSVQSLTKTQNATINITNTGNTALSNINLSSTGDINVSFSSNNFALNAGSSILVNVNSLTDLNSLNLGSHTVTILAKDIPTNAADTLTYTVAKDFCDKGNINASKIEISDLDDKDSENEWEWKPLDNVKIEVEVGNNLDRDEDFVAELAIFDTEEEEFIEIDDEKSLTYDLSIDEDDSDTATFEFQVPAEMEDSEGRYVVYVKAYVDGDEDAYCNSYAAEDVPSSSVEPLKITKKSHEVVLDELTASSTVKPGETVVISARAFNIGANDEDKVKVVLTNTKLGLNLESSSFSLDIGESDEVDFSFVIPDTAESGVYSLRLISYFYYKKSSDSYSKNSDTFEVKLTVAGGANTTTSTATSSGITASLTSSAKAGSQMEVKATIRNLGTTQSTFVVGVTDYEDWASLNSISDRIVSLGA